MNQAWIPRLLIFPLVLLFCSGAGAQDDNELKFYLSEDAVQGRASTGAGFIGLPGGRLALGVFTNEEDDLVGDLGISYGLETIASSPWDFQIGGRLYVGTIDVLDDNFAAFALGGEVGYAIPAQVPTRLIGSIYYAPRIASTGDAERLVDYGIDLEFQLLENAAVFVGYRMFEVELDNGSSPDLDEDLHLGARFRF